METRKKYNYFYNGQAIQKSRFLEAVPEDWEDEADNNMGYYTYGYYKAVLREEETED